MLGQSLFLAVVMAEKITMCILSIHNKQKKGNHKDCIFLQRKFFYGIIHLSKKVVKI